MTVHLLVPPLQASTQATDYNDDIFDLSDRSEFYLVTTLSITTLPKFGLLGISLFRFGTLSRYNFTGLRLGINPSVLR